VVSKTYNSPLILVGPTASGKSALAERLARREGFEILSADSMLVYWGMDIGTAKPTAQERDGIFYHGMDLVNPDEKFSTGLWLEHARKALEDCATRGHRMLVVGGTGLYIKALLQGIDAPTADPEARKRYETLFAEKGIGALHEEANRLSSYALSTLNADDLKNPRRVIRLLEKLSVIERERSTGFPACATEKHYATPLLDASATTVLCLSEEPAILAQRIAFRVEKMFADGLLDEVRGLYARYRHAPPDSALFKAIGYAEAVAVINGTLTETQAKEIIVTRTRQYARRQRTFFRHQLPCTPMPAPVDEDDVARCAEKMVM